MTTYRIRLVSLEQKVRSAGGTDLDVRQVLTFQRFLNNPHGLGWGLYALGGPAPPVDYDDVHPTAWPIPA